MQDDRNKILTQALFLMGKDDFDLSVCQDQESFRSLMMALFRVIYPDLKAWTVADDHRIHFTDPTIKGKVTANGFMNPARLFEQVRPFDPDWNKQFVSSEVIQFIRNGVEELRRQVAAVDPESGTSNSPHRSVSKIVPLLKSDAMISGMEQSSSFKGGVPDRYRLLSWPLVGRVRVVPAFDTPENFHFMHRYDADELGITPDEARDHALANFRTMAMRIKMRNDYTKPLVVIDRIGGIASSLLLLPEFWEKEAIKARDELVIHVAEYDTLLVARKGDRQGMESLIGMAISGAVQSVFSPPVIFVFDKNGLRLLERSDVA
ncbi:hypothetical protein OIU34_22280 [Pararhizobium sp. BT-229]|uniref:hypothetical protein n=1 Tax=Pararhizobium sp. BT-229 TaxID=2986923 RepID=UPI0021F6A78B|nr:hypothetical protein [Pararhizobium sp. BT-229]MCV9964622.1 hypothetical protein [Pararhizobium sp. BT-229]